MLKKTEKSSKSLEAPNMKLGFQNSFIFLYQEGYPGSYYRLIYVNILVQVLVAIFYLAKIKCIATDGSYTDDRSPPPVRHMIVTV